MPVLPGTTDHVPGTLGGVTFRLFGDDFTAVSPNLSVPVSVWSIRENADDLNLTTAGVVGTRGGVVSRPVEWSATLPDRLTAAVTDEEDPLYDPEASPFVSDYSALYAGRAATVWFRLGDHDCWHRIRNTIITYAGPVCDATGDVIRWTVSGKHGTLDRYTVLLPANE